MKTLFDLDELQENKFCEYDLEKGFNIEIIQQENNCILKYSYSKLIETVLNYKPFEYIQHYCEKKLFDTYEQAKEVAFYIIEHHERLKPVENWKEIR